MTIAKYLAWTVHKDKYSIAVRNAPARIVMGMLS